MADEFNQNMQNPQVQQAVSQALDEQKKKKRKKRLIIIGVILAVLVIGGIIGSMGDDGKKTVENPDNTSAVSEAESAEAQQEDQKVKVGSTVTLDTYKVKFVSCNADYKKYSKYAAPEKGNKVIRAEFEYENTSDSDVSLSGFDCYADDKKCEEFYSPDDYKSPTLESVSPHRTFKAIVYYQVPEKAKTVELEMEDDLWGNTKTIFVIE